MLVVPATIFSAPRSPLNNRRRNGSGTAEGPVIKALAFILPLLNDGHIQQFKHNCEISKWQTDYQPYRVRSLQSMCKASSTKLPAECLAAEGTMVICLRSL